MRVPGQKFFVPANFLAAGMARSYNNAIVYVNWNNIAELKLLTAS
jgi:hypothetical protein